MNHHAELMIMNMRTHIIRFNPFDIKGFSGWRAVGYQGSVFDEKPNIDRLAKEGMVFTQGYAGAGNCQPSCACLMSGRCSDR